MTPTLTCADVDASALIERYVARRLGPEELERFEEHLFECERCPAEVRFAAGMRHALRDGPVAVADGPAAATAGRARRYGLFATALAAAVAAVLLLPRGDDDALRRLGAVSQPPIYLGVAVRGATSPADSAFEAAMSAYTAGSYEEAASGLRAALEAGAAPAPVWFFLGASLLMWGDAEAAAQAFGGVVALGDSPYLAEAHYYRAKTLLRLGRRGAALDQLGRAEAAGGRIARAAAALADSVRAAAAS